MNTGHKLIIMTNKFSLQTALELILEEKEEAEKAVEDFSEKEDHVSENSESESDFDEEGKEEDRPTTQQPGEGNPPAVKRQRTSERVPPPCQQSVPAPACQQQDSAQRDMGHESIWPSKDGNIEWCSTSRPEPPHIAASEKRMVPGPTRLAVDYVVDIRSSFDMFMPPPIKNIILTCSNIEGKECLERGGKI